MNALRFNLSQCYIEKEGKTMLAAIKPPLSFEYESLDYNSDTMGFGRLHNEDFTITGEQGAEIETYIESVSVNPVDQAKFDAQVYLSDTDWMAMRKADSGVAIPDDVVALRAEARVTISQV